MAILCQRFSAESTARRLRKMRYRRSGVARFECRETRSPPADAWISRGRFWLPRVEHQYLRNLRYFRPEPKAATKPERMIPPAADATIPGIGVLDPNELWTRYPLATPPMAPATRISMKRVKTFGGGGSGSQKCIITVIETAPPVTNHSSSRLLMCSSMEGSNPNPRFTTSKIYFDWFVPGTGPYRLRERAVAFPFVGTALREAIDAECAPPNCASQHKTHANVVVL